jgi:hypothetical protein
MPAPEMSFRQFPQVDQHKTVAPEMNNGYQFARPISQA